jgi:hypothetical protein
MGDDLHKQTNIFIANHKPRNVEMCQGKVAWANPLFSV